MQCTTSSPKRVITHRYVTSPLAFTCHFHYCQGIRAVARAKLQGSTRAIRVTVGSPLHTGNLTLVTLNTEHLTYMTAGLTNCNAQEGATQEWLLKANLDKVRVGMAGSTQQPSMAVWHLDPLLPGILILNCCPCSALEHPDIFKPSCFTGRFIHCHGPLRLL